MLRWEQVTTNGGPDLVKRAKVPGGWLIWAQYEEAVVGVYMAGLTFVPDPNHEWNEESQA